MEMGLGKRGVGGDRQSYKLTELWLDIPSLSFMCLLSNHFANVLKIPKTVAAYHTNYWHMTDTGSIVAYFQIAFSKSYILS